MLQFVLYSLVAGQLQPAPVEVTAVITASGECTLQDGWAVDGGVAWGSLVGAPDVSGSQGWAKLTIISDEDAEDGTQMFAAGCVEGYLTAAQIADWRYNFGAVLFGEGKGSVFWKKKI